MRQISKKVHGPDGSGELENLDSGVDFTVKSTSLYVISVNFNCFTVFSSSSLFFCLQRFDRSFDDLRMMHFPLRFRIEGCHTDDLDMGRWSS